MKNIHFNVDEITPTLAIVSSVINSKNALPILSNVCIETKDDGNGGAYIVMMASDCETWLQMVATCSFADIGISICIDAKSLLQALRNLTGTFVKMAIDEERRIVKCTYGNGHFSLPYESMVDYPLPFVKPEGAKEKSMDSQKLLYAIEKAGFATANDELRPVMNGIRFEFFVDGMVAVASDGHKLAKYKDFTVNEVEAIEVCGFTMPKKPSQILMNVLANTIAGDVRIAFNDNCFTVNNKQFKLSARLIEGRYPNYDSVIPKDNDKIITLEKSAFISALRRVLPLGSSISELVALTFENGKMTVSAQDFDFNTAAEEHITCDYVGDRFAIGFKGSVLLQMLQNLDSDTIVLAMKDPMRAGILKEKKENTIYDYTSLIMPMLIQ